MNHSRELSICPPFGLSGGAGLIGTPLERGFFIVFVVLLILFSAVSNLFVIVIIVKKVGYSFWISNSERNSIREQKIQLFGIFSSSLN